jgi:4-amino-4-deoxy-L-arabinose transferase-like glycosyltransferase
VLLGVAVVAVVGLALRLFWLTHQSLWNDEIVTFISSTGTPWRVMTQRQENSNIPPLYYLVVNAALALRGIVGVEAALRLPSVVMGTLSIPLLYFVVRWWLGDRIAVIAAALMAISPFHVWYSQEARPYALLLALALVAVLCLQRALVHPESRLWKAATAIALASTFYCHTVAVAFIAFAAFYVLVATAHATLGPHWIRQLRREWPRLWRTQWREWLLTFVAVAVLCVPGVYRLVSFPPTNSADTDRAFSPFELAYAVWSFAVGYSLGPSLWELHSPDRGAIILRYGPIIAPVAVAVATLALLGLGYLRRRAPRAGVVLALWFAFPLAFVILGALVTVHPFNVRYTMIAFVPAIILIAVGFAAVSRARLAMLGWATVSVIALAQYYFDPRYARDDNRGAAQFFVSHAQPGELVIAHRAFTAKDFRFYAPPPLARVLPYPQGVSLAAVDVPHDLARRIADAPRFWLFLSRSLPDEDAPLLAFCNGTYHRDPARSYSSTGVTLLACERAPSAVSAAGEAPPTITH